jgi:hypothetical protein
MKKNQKSVKFQGNTITCNYLKSYLSNRNLSVITFATMTSLFFSSMPIGAYETFFAKEEYEEIVEDEMKTERDEEIEELLKMKSVILEERIEQEKIEEESMRVLEFDNCVSEYASYFHMDGVEVAKAANTFTNHYTENMEYFNDTTTEGFAISFVYSLYNGNLDSFGLERSCYMTEEEVTFIEVDEVNETVILENGYVFDEFVSHVAYSIGEDPYLALAISHFETGYQSSYQAREKNNFGGLKNSDGFFTLPTPEAGIVYFVMTVQSILNNYEVDNLEELSGVYVNGDIDSIDEIWVSGVNSIYNKINDLDEEVSLVKSLKLGSF